MQTAPESTVDTATYLGSPVCTLHIAHKPDTPSLLAQCSTVCTPTLLTQYPSMHTYPRDLVSQYAHLPS